MRRFAVAAGAVVVLALGGVVAQAAIPDADGNIYACYDSKGAVRVQGDASPCPKGWTALTWAAGQNANVPVTTTYKVTAEAVVAPGGNVGGALASCHDGDLATGGGYFMHDSTLEDGRTRALASLPTERADGSTSGWAVTFTNNGASDVQVEVYAVCQHTE